jgi:hypothetical protein
LSGGNEENHEEPLLGWAICERVYETITSNARSRKLFPLISEVWKAPCWFKKKWKKNARDVRFAEVKEQQKQHQEKEEYKDFDF